MQVQIPVATRAAPQAGPAQAGPAGNNGAPASNPFAQLLQQAAQAARTGDSSREHGAKSGGGQKAAASDNAGNTSSVVSTRTVPGVPPGDGRSPVNRLGKRQLHKTGKHNQLVVLLTILLGWFRTQPQAVKKVKTGQSGLSGPGQQLLDRLLKETPRQRQASLQQLSSKQLQQVGQVLQQLASDVNGPMTGKENELFSHMLAKLDGLEQASQSQAQQGGSSLKAKEPALNPQSLEAVVQRLAVLAGTSPDAGAKPGGVKVPGQSPGQVGEQANSTPGQAADGLASQEVQASRAVDKLASAQAGQQAAPDPRDKSDKQSASQLGVNTVSALTGRTLQAAQTATKGQQATGAGGQALAVQQAMQRAVDWVQSMQISRQDAGKWNATLQLKPAQLGQMQVALEWQAGQLTAHFLVDNAAARNLVQQQASTFANQISMVGSDLAGFTVDVQDHNQPQERDAGSPGGQDTGKRQAATTESPQLRPARPSYRFI